MKKEYKTPNLKKLSSITKLTQMPGKLGAAADGKSNNANS